jgi:two-component system chemotaxis sensor kinase CheA
LIFAAGLSTADAVSNLSGRGVGMDVVRQNIAALRGTVEIESELGVGTLIRIRLPLTLAIIDGFLVSVQASTFVIPLETVIECVELTQEQSAAAHGCDYINLRGEVLPFIRLKDLFAVAEQSADELAAAGAFDGSRSLLTAEGAAALARDPELTFLLHPVARENIVVVNYAGRRAGIVVDRLTGEFQTVIRPLGDVFGGLDGVSGFTIMGDGRVAPILDVANLVRRAAALESQVLLTHADVAPADTPHSRPRSPRGNNDR